MLKRGFDDLASQLPRLADAEAADGVSGKADFDGALGRFLAQGKVHATLHNAEEGLSRFRPCRDSRPRLSGRAEAQRRSLQTGELRSP